MLFSRQLLGVYKPSPEAYQRALQLVKLQPEEVGLVAAHAYDLEGAHKVGLRTIYIHQWTDDTDEDMDKVRSEFDFYLDDMVTLSDTVARLQVEVWTKISVNLHQVLRHVIFMVGIFDF